MGPIPRNIVANIVGQGWAAAMQLVLVPLYIRLLGVEAYGLIGIYATLQASLQILDLGLSQTMSRQMAHYQAFPDKAAESRDFVRTIEVGYWAVAIAIGVGVIAGAPLLTNHWVKLGAIPPETAQRAFMIMGAVAACQWPLSLYEGGLLGLQRQVLLNVLKIAVSTFGAIGTVLVLVLGPRTITAYFGWQALVAAVNVALFAVALWRSLPRSAEGAAVRARLLVLHWRFAAGMGGIAVTGILLSQLDKVLLSRLLTLEAFGFYTLAGVVANVVPFLLAGPVFNGIFPQLTRLAGARDDHELRMLYHRGTQLMAVLVATLGGVLVCFSREILLVWTRNAAAAASAAPIASVLVVGMATNALMSLPYALQLSHGWTSIGLRINLGLMVFLVPAIVLLTSHFGPVGAAGAWVALNAAYMLVGVPLTHRRLLRGEMARWFLADILPPSGAALAVIAVGRWVVAGQTTALALVVQVGAVFVVALGAAVLAAPLVRRALVDALARRRALEGR